MIYSYNSHIYEDIVLWFPPITSCFFEDEEVTSHGPIQSEMPTVREECYSLPQGFCWDTLDVGNPEQVRDQFLSFKVPGLHFCGLLFCFNYR